MYTPPFSELQLTLSQHWNAAPIYSNKNAVQCSFLISINHHY